MQLVRGKLLVGALLAMGAMPGSALAATVKACVKNSNGSIRVVASAAACSSSETFLEWNKNGPYGDGSAGSAIVTEPSVLGDNAQFTNLTIQDGGTLFVQPGTVIRCTGTFTNNGTIRVGETQNWGDVRTPTAGDLYPSFHVPLAGVSRGLPFVGQLGDATLNREGGFGGRGHQADLVRNETLMPTAGGGGGAGRFDAFGASSGGAGGGHLAILAQEAIVNAGVILANGNQIVTGGGGGGGGGVVLLASAGSITHSGTVEAQGGAGASAGPTGGPGGGGGGGYVRLVSPSITTSGTFNVSGGPAGPAGGPGTVTSNFRQGGGGGGACFGSGGRGGDALPTGATTVGFPGQTGLVIQTLSDPTSLF